MRYIEFLAALSVIYMLYRYIYHFYETKLILENHSYVRRMCWIQTQGSGSQG